MNKKNKNLLDAHIKSIFTLYSNGQIKKALDIIKALINDYPNEPLLFNISGICYKANNQLDAAVDSFEKAIAIKPDDIKAYFNLGIIHMEMGKLGNAIRFYEKVLVLNPNYTDAHYNLGVIFKELGNLDDAVKSYKKVLDIKPNHVAAYNNLGVSLKELGHQEEAVKSYKKAIAIKPDFADAHNNLGVSLKELGHLEEAVISYKKAITIKPDFADACNNLGNVLKDLSQLDTAVIAYKNAITIKPDFADAANNLGIVLHELGQLNDAVKSFEMAIVIKPDFADAANNLGIVQHELGQLNDAVKSFEMAIVIKSDFVEAYRNHGKVLMEINRTDEAMVSYESAFSLNPDLDFLLGDYLHIKRKLGIWDDWATHLNELTIKVNNGLQATSPFPLLGLIDNPEMQKKSAEIFSDKFYPQSYDLPKIEVYPRHKKIRIAYFSGDFHNHPGMHLMAELFECHNKIFFELIAFSFGPDTHDKWRQRVSVCFDQFIDVKLKSDREISLLARKMEIDIAVNRGGYTQGGRPNIFAEGCAPIQVNYLGYPGTTGAEYMDYIIADRALIPEDKQQYYSEKIVYMPNSYQVNMSNREVSKNSLIRDELGLPVKGFVFCCFNNAYKITPSTFSGWMRILSAVEDSVLWLFESNTTSNKNLKNEAIKLGINEDRIIFAKRMPVEDHLNRIKEADLFLDTLPYNAHTTASDALRMGLPVLTCEGNSFASRVAASLLRAVNLPELITTTQKQYESLAIQLATNPEKLKMIKDKLIYNIPTAVLYDTPLYTRQLESAYLEMYERYQNGLNPDHIYLEH
ncbi:tetratricopeptide repeat protein [Candidatus Pseudothioglobus sp. Uisw_041]|uniref:tetratricopeptide repeat protein n=1 Tax=Candidatus Pseudothioglobus sp. Uisw_041 TaxID=3230996 RepID=UPI003A869540